MTPSERNTLREKVISAWRNLPIPDSEKIRHEVDYDYPPRLRGPSVRIAGRKFDEVDLSAPEIETESVMGSLSPEHAVYYLGTHILHALDNEFLTPKSWCFSPPFIDLTTWMIDPGGYEKAKYKMSPEIKQTFRLFCLAILNDWERFAREGGMSEFSRREFSRIASECERK